MTEPQKIALKFLAGRPYATPSEIGEAMLRDRKFQRARTAQGLGRIGGAMGSRLTAFGWAADASNRRGGFPAYRITEVGRTALKLTTDTGERTK